MKDYSTKNNVPLERIAIVGPLPPPFGGMANQARQLRRLLEADGFAVEFVQSNCGYSPKWIGSLWGIRAVFRLVPFVYALWRATTRAQLFHILANSGWSWHLFAAPAVWIAAIRRVPVIVNYRGGGAGAFLARSLRLVRPTLDKAQLIVVPSDFLSGVFRESGYHTEIIPNIIDLDLFSSQVQDKIVWSSDRLDDPHLIVTRNLESIYGIETALQAFCIIRNRYPAARLSIAGEGEERSHLEALAGELDLSDAVNFIGRLPNEQIPQLYRNGDVMLNPSLVDNMPISILEAFASRVPVVSTDVGGIPYMVENEKTALLVPPGNPERMAEQVIRLLGDSRLYSGIVNAGAECIKQYEWAQVGKSWLGAYQKVLPG